MSINYAEELNRSQYEVVTYSKGPSLVIAGAGSGKTRVLTYKIAYLLENEYEPWNILALTFTNKAAREMKERITDKVGTRARYLWMGTFHSIFSRILRIEAAHIGFTPQFTIYDTSDSKSLLRAIIKEMGLDDKVYLPGNVQSHISHAKNQLISPSAYAMSNEIYNSDCAAKMPAIRDIYKRYWDRCRQASAMDFDDLLFYTFILFRDNPEVLHKYQQQFRYVLVDEYQDTNFAQHQIVSQLCQERQMLCVVGDDAQSIYSFRGAKIDNILTFTILYPTAKVFKLEQNYRSTQNIVGAANSLIEKNQRQIKKEVFSEKERGETITVFQAYSDSEEPEIIANKIVELRRKNKYDYHDFAILYRTNAQSRVFEATFRKRGMPYKIYGGLSFYQRKEIKDVISYFRLVINPNDEEAFKRIINYPTRGIGETTLKKIIIAAAVNEVSLWKVIKNPLQYELQINKTTFSRLTTFITLIDDFIDLSTAKNAYEVATEIIRRSGIGNEINSDNAPETLSRKENIEELINGVHDFCVERMEEGNMNVTLGDFLTEVALLTDQDTDKSNDERKITLMTIHAAKGLEFPNVFVVGLEEGLFPNARAIGSENAMEEERRLFYVAITRAEDHCFLSFSRTRQLYGKTEFAIPSRFLRDIDECYLAIPEEMIGKQYSGYKTNIHQQRDLPEKTDLNSYSPPKQSSGNALSQYTLPKQHMKRVSSSTVPSQGAGNAMAASATLSAGKLIEHERFGIGEVIKIEGKGDNLKATIQFKHAGIKQLLLRFARFKVID